MPSWWRVLASAAPTSWSWSSSLRFSDRVRLVLARVAIAAFLGFAHRVFTAGGCPALSWHLGTRRGPLALVVSCRCRLCFGSVPGAVPVACRGVVLGALGSARGRGRGCRRSGSAPLQGRFALRRAVPMGSAVRDSDREFRRTRRPFESVCTRSLFDVVSAPVGRRRRSFPLYCKSCSRRRRGCVVGAVQRRFSLVRYGVRSSALLYAMGLSPAVPFSPPLLFSASSRSGGTPCCLAACVPAALRTGVRTWRAVSECSCAALRTSVSFRLDAFGGIVSACRCAHPARCAGCRRAPRRAARRRCCGVLRRAPFSSPAGWSSGCACA